MLVLFRFKNFGSFKDEVVFDMRAVKAYKEHQYNLFQEDENNAVLKVAAIYGANASGKSTFVNAYATFARIVRDSFKNNNKKDDPDETAVSEYYNPFFFDDTSFGACSEFEAVYHFNGSEYRYGFSYTDRQIDQEWLYKTSLSSKRQVCILERTSQKIELGASVKKSCEKYLSNIDSDVLALSFLSSLKLKTTVFEDTNTCVGSILAVSFANTRENLRVLDRYFISVFNAQEKATLLQFLSAIDVGIKNIEVDNNKDRILVYTYHAGKNGKMYKYPLLLESDGTKQAIVLYSFVRIAVLQGKGLIADEFSNQLHPLLQKFIISLFYKNPTSGQLIYTTHDTMLLDKQFMRRDQVWFAEKNEDGESSLYSLADFRIRNDKSFGKDYLGGSYGGIPILKDFGFEKEDA